MSSISVFDFFSGCGGTSLGFRQAGMKIKCAIDIDSDSLDSFKYNIPEALCINSDIRTLETDTIKNMISNDEEILFSACAPCQPFTRQNTLKDANDSRIDLLEEFSRFVVDIMPHHIFLENVPGLQKINDKKNSPLSEFIGLIDKLGYKYKVKIIKLSNFGVPQTRRRLILIASRKGEIIFPNETHGTSKNLIPYSTVRDWIGGLPLLAAGSKDPNDSEHQSASLSKINAIRIANTPMGGGRMDWPLELQLNCHKKYGGHTDVYGRMHWDRPASGLTTRCISYSNGRYGHPEQNRAISVREAGRLQTFPIEFRWFGNLNSKSRQIGNAVPPLLSRSMAEAFKKI